MGKLPSPLAYAHFSRRVGGEGACFHGSSRHGKRELRIPPHLPQGKIGGFAAAGDLLPEEPPGP